MRLLCVGYAKRFRRALCRCVIAAIVSCFRKHRCVLSFARYARATRTACPHAFPYQRKYRMHPTSQRNTPTNKDEGQGMNTPPFSSCQYTSQKLKARNASAAQKRHGRRSMSSTSLCTRSFSAASSSGVMGRNGFKPHATSLHSSLESSLPR